MNVYIWDIKKSKWLTIEHVECVVKITREEFKLDNKIYKKAEYELSFIFDSSFGK